MCFGRWSSRTRTTQAAMHRGRFSFLRRDRPESKTLPSSARYRSVDDVQVGWHVRHQLSISIADTLPDESK
jgi:hypothetical protein